MTCPICGDKGVMRVKYHDGSPDEFGICLCAMGQRMRSSVNARHLTNPLWHAWAAREGIDFEAVAMVEDLLDPEDLARIPTAAPVDTPRSIAAAMQTVKRKGPRL